jgi:dTDP-4-amino-4,6-dideoxygalactose transaminase
VTSDGAPDVSLLEDALSPNTRAVLLSHTAGYPFDLKAARNFCNDYELWLIEDATEAFDATYDFDGTCYKTGTVGDIGTGCLAQREGDLGFVCTRDDNLSLILQALRNDVLHWMVPSCAVLPSCADVRRASADRLAQALSPFAKRVEALRGTVHAAPASLPVLFACPDDRAAVIRQLELAKIPYRLPTNVANEPFFMQLCRENKARVFAVPTVAEKLAACGLLLSFDNEAGTVAALREALQ